jgi:hypothetical protein
MNTFLQFFKGSALFTIVSVILGFLYGQYLTGTVQGGIATAMILLVLGILETSLSFDNAIVNAKVLNTMDDKWRHRFITWGMLIAVFGMRVLFPILIVAIFAQIGIIEAFGMAIHDPKKYADTLISSHIMIAGFGGTFLLLVALKYFFDSEKDVHWIEPIESWLSNAGNLKSVELILTLAIVYGVTFLVPAADRFAFMVAAIAGLICHEVVHGIAELLQAKEEHDLAAGLVKGGIMSFLYLEVLDASFSFDGVIGAFVLSNNIFIIALGLGIGAMFVRSLTIMFVEKKTLSEFRYLEHGAFWSILILAGIMFASIKYEIPEWVTGGLSVVFIGFALLSSILHSKKEKVA